MPELTLSQIQARKRQLAIRITSIDWDLAELRSDRSDLAQELAQLETAEIKLHIQTYGITYIIGNKPKAKEPTPNKVRQPDAAKILREMSKEELRNLLRSLGVI